MLLILTDTLVFVRAELVTGYGNSRTRDWGHATRAALAGNVQPLSSSEKTGAKDVLTTRHRVFIDGAAETEPIEWVDSDGSTRLDTLNAQATDRIEWNSSTYEIEGKPQKWPSPIGGGIHHIELTIAEVRGG